MKISEAFEQLDALRVANALGLEYGVVCKWRDRESIPAYWRVKFVNLMNHHNVAIKLHDLAGGGLNEYFIFSFGRFVFIKRYRY